MKNLIKPPLLLPILFIYSHGIFAQVSLVKNIDPKVDSSYSSNPGYITRYNNGILYASNDPGTGRELWFSDGTIDNTRIVKNISSFDHSNPSNPDFYMYGNPQSDERHSFEVLNNKIFFVAKDDAHGYELWLSNGTESGTFIVKDIFPGLKGSQPRRITKVGNVLFFIADDGTNGEELWKTDGTSEGTLLVKDIKPGPNGSSVSELTPVDDKLVFTADDGVHGEEPWVSSGFENTTHLLSDTGLGLADTKPYSYCGNANEIYFSSTKGLFKSVISSGETSLILQNVKQKTRLLAKAYFNARLYYVQYDSSQYQYNVSALYSTDGVLHDTIRSFDNTAMITEYFSWLSVVDNELYLSFSKHDKTNQIDFFDPIATNQFIYKLDNTSNKFELILNFSKDTYTLFFEEIDKIKYFIKQQDTYYCISSFSYGDYLIKKSITTEPEMVEEIKYLSPVTDIQVSNGKLYLTSIYGDGELWTSDGTTIGTKRLKNTFTTTSSHPKRLTVFKDYVYFIANDNEIPKLWRTDGTTSGTTVFATTVNPNPDNRLIVSKNYLYFFSATTTGNDLWRTDGTEEGTSLVYSGNVYDCIPSDDLTYFFVWYDYSHVELWKDNGTNTEMLKSFAFGGFGAALKDKIIFSGKDNTYGTEVWISDGTVQGTKLLKDINAGGESSYPDFYKSLVVNDNLYFAAREDMHGLELWTTDGTAEGTKLYWDFNPGPDYSWPLCISNTENGIIVRASGEATAFNAVTNGTPEGTKILFNGYTEDIRGNNGVAYFTFENDLYKTDGTISGTIKVYNFGNKDYYSYIDNVIDGWVYINANDGIHGSELWVSDGTPQGTFLAGDISPDSSYPSYIVKLDTTIIFAVGNGDYANGLWKWNYEKPTVIETGIDKTDSFTLSLFPNPSNGKFNIATNHPIDKIVLREIQGKVIFDNVDTKRDNGDAVYFEVSLNPGVYILSLTSKGKVVHKKIAIK